MFNEYDGQNNINSEYDVFQNRSRPLEEQEEQKTDFSQPVAEPSSTMGTNAEEGSFGKETEVPPANHQSIPKASYTAPSGEQTTPQSSYSAQGFRQTADSDTHTTPGMQQRYEPTQSSSAQYYHTASSSVGQTAADPATGTPVSPQYPNNNSAGVNQYMQNPSYSNPNMGYAPSGAPKAKKKESRRTGRFVAMFMAAILVGGGAGLGGTILADRLNLTGQNPSVLTQSVVNTSDKQENADGSLAAVVEATENSVVEIRTENIQTSEFMQQYSTSGAGSGVIISDDGYIVTNNHVIEDADKITVTLKNGTSYDAALIGSDATTDVAVIKIEDTGLTAAVLGDSDSLSVGDTVLAIGNPLGELGGTVTDGIISALDREIAIDNQTMTLLQTSAAVNSGNSGGGLFSSNGELIGIVNAKSSGSGIEGLGFAIPINTAKPVIEDIINNGYVTGRIKLGVTFVDILTQENAAQYRVSDLGTYVYQLTPGSDAEIAGLQVGDLIQTIDGTKVYQSSEVKELMEDYSVGDSMDITVKRNGQEVTLTVTFTEDTPQ